MTSVSGAVVWSGKYSSFGKVTVDASSAIVNPLRFPGQYEDVETGLHYNYHRYYDPATGRYTSADLIGINGGINLYTYTVGNPVNAVDPRGLSPDCSNGFCAVGTTIEDLRGELSSALGIDHVDITYNGRVVYIGAGGGVGRENAEYKSTNANWSLSKLISGKFQWGNKAGKPCKKECDDGSEANWEQKRMPTDGDILNCLRSKPRSSGKNCQGDVKDAVDGCCLSGFSTLISDVFPEVLGY